MDLKRIKVYGTVILKGHILNWPWRSHIERRRIRGEVTQKAVCSYLQQFVPEHITDDSGRRIKDDGQEERIFTIWLQGEEKAPEIVKACLRSIRHNCSQQLVVLDSRTLPEWISLPDHIIRKWQEGKIRAAHFADICRVELLYRYGGIWMDATCFATSAVPEEIMAEDFFIYLSGNRLKGLYSFVQNCFFRSRKGDYLLKAWREAILNYWESEDSIIDYFAHQLLFKVTVEKNPEAMRHFARMPHIAQDPTHTVWEEHKDDMFDRDIFERLTKDAFFQKTEYKSRSAKDPVRGSFSDVMQNMYRQ